MSDSDNTAALADIDSAVQACTRCALHRSATRGVPGEGPIDAAVMLVGEGPGFNEDKQGRPFVGAAGRFLDETLLPLAGLRRSEVYITNVVKHRPPDNRDPLPDELSACLPYLEQQIAFVNPRLIVTLGRFSLGTFFPGEKISQVHGRMRSKAGRYIFPMYHPAAALHQERLRDTLEEDMKRLGAFIRDTMNRNPALAEENDEAPEQLTLF